MDPATAKTLVSSVLVACIAAFSLVSFRAMVAEVAEDLRRAVRVPATAPVRRHPDA